MPDDTAERHPSDGWPVRPFPAGAALEAWLDNHHADEPGLWVKFAKKGRGIASVSLPEAIEVATCFGWVDSKMHRYDEDYYVLRFQPRRARSHWSAGNRELAERLIADGRMRPAGLVQVAAARATGRWADPPAGPVTPGRAAPPSARAPAPPRSPRPGRR